MIPEYLNLFVGHSHDPKNRNAGSSGGLGTEILKFLLYSGVVDAVVAVGFDENDKTKPVYRIVDDFNNIFQLSGSKYTFMEAAPLIKLIKENSEKKLAVIVQPCFVQLIKNEFKNVLYIISFFCGYNNIYEATEYLLKKGGVNKAEVSSIDYRGGNYPGGFKIITTAGRVINFGKENYELINLMFLRKGCANCRFYISENADLALGDAWIRGAEKNTLLVINSSKGDDLIKKMYEQNLISLYDLDRGELLEMHRHNLAYKKNGHTLAMKIIVKIFNNKIARKIAPFYFLGIISRLRRKYMVGIKKELRLTNKYQ